MESRSMSGPAVNKLDLCVDSSLESLLCLTCVDYNERSSQSWLDDLVN